MEYLLSEEQKAAKKEFEDFFREEMKAAPICYHGTHHEAVYSNDEGWEFHKYMQKKLGEKGWLSMAWPKEYGGRDASIIVQLMFNEVHSFYHAPGIDGFGLNMFAPTLMLFANDEQKARLLPLIAKGTRGWFRPGFA
jgi:alkylation response protein AidB-like acyl-CoA dehydrogenase